MKATRILAACGALALALQTLPAAADTGPWYVGAGGGSATYGVPSSITYDFAPPLSSGPDRLQITNGTSATAYRLDAGYRLGPYFALEGLYADFGSVASHFTGTSPPFSFSGSTKVKAWGIEAVGRLPLSGGFGLFARAGLVRYTDDFDRITITLNPPTSPIVSFSAVSASDTTSVFGAGADYAFTDDWSIRAAFDYYKKKTDSVSSYMPGVHALSVEVLYHF